MQIYLQKKDGDQSQASWRPFLICVSEDSFYSRDSFDLVRWISHKYGFGTYMHYLNGYLSKNTYKESKKIQNKLLKLLWIRVSNILLQTFS